MKCASRTCLWIVLGLLLLAVNANAEDISGVQPNRYVVGLHPLITAVGGGTSPYTVTATDSVINCNNTTGAPFTIQLPQITTLPKPGQILEIKDTSSTGAECDILPDSHDTIEPLTATGPLGTTASPNEITLSGPNDARKIQSDSALQIWRILSGVNGTSTYGKCIPSLSPITIQPVDGLKKVCDALLPCYPFDPGVGNTYMSVGLGQLVFTYSGPTPSSILTQLKYTCGAKIAHPMYTDPHGSNYIGVSPVTVPVVSAIDDAKVMLPNDPLSPLDNPDPLFAMHTYCSVRGGPGCDVELDVQVFGGAGTAINVVHGPAVLANGSDTALVIKDEMHFNLGR